MAADNILKLLDKVFDGTLSVRPRKEETKENLIRPSIDNSMLGLIRI
jgi:hypothetical protein